LPCGEGTAYKPLINPETNESVDEFPNRSFSSDEILEAGGLFICADIRTGPHADHLLIFHIDENSLLKNASPLLFS